MKAKIRGTEIYFDVAGMQLEPHQNTLVEKPVLFLIHGGPGGNHVHFKDDSLELQKYAQLVFVDQRGCGLSKKGRKSDYTLDNNIEDIEALRKYLGLNKICLLGVSYGGIVAQGYAIRYSKNIEKLILVVTAPSHHFLEEARENLNNIGSAKQIAVCEKYLWNGRFTSDKTVNYYFKCMDSLYLQHKNKKRRRITAIQTKAGVRKNKLAYEVLNAGFSSFLHQFNFIPKLKKITCPTLILAGKKDWICSFKQSLIIAKNIPQAKIKIFNEAGHSLILTENEKYIKIVRNFLK